MIRMTVKLLDSGEVRRYYCSESEAECTLRLMFPRETSQHARLMSCVQAINDEGFAEVEVEPFRDPTRSQYPPDFDKQDQGEDPWPREADRE